MYVCIYLFICLFIYVRIYTWLQFLMLGAIKQTNPTQNKLTYSIWNVCFNFFVIYIKFI